MKNVSLLVDPPTVRRFEHATLRCFYDLQNAPLYSVKFYRGLREFYRFSPTEVPNKKIFAFPGINVDVSIEHFVVVFLMEKLCLLMYFLWFFFNRILCRMQV